MNRSEVERVESLLGLCYEGVECINEDRYIVKDGEVYLIVDKNNNEIYKSKDRLSLIGNSVFKEIYRYKWKRIDIETLEEYGIEHIEPKECGSMIISGSYGCLGLYDKDDNTILPSGYWSIRFVKEDANELIVNVYVDKLNFNIIIDKKTNKPNFYIEIESGVHGLSFVSIEERTEHFYYFETNKYELYNQYTREVLTSGRYNKMMIDKGSGDRKLIRVIRDNCVGLIDLEGKKVVGLEHSFKEVNYLNYNGIFIVAKHKYNENGEKVLKWGVYKEGVGIQEELEYDEYGLFGDLYISYLGKRVGKDIKWYIVGNDGNAHEGITSAFPIETVPNTGIYRINVYGLNWVVDRNLKMLNVDISNMEGWVRVS